jgi:hypothetical protein
VAEITHNHALDMGSAQRRPLPDFADRLAIMPDFLPPHTFAALRAEAERLASPERNYVPVHKKGGTVAYETLRGLAGHGNFLLGATGATQAGSPTAPGRSSCRRAVAASDFGRQDPTLPDIRKGAKARPLPIPPAWRSPDGAGTARHDQYRWNKYAAGNQTAICRA